MPAELQQRVQEEVELTKRRSGWPVERTLSALGVSRNDVLSLAAGGGPASCGRTLWAAAAAGATVRGIAGGEGGGD